MLVVAECIGHTSHVIRALGEYNLSLQQHEYSSIMASPEKEVSSPLILTS